MVLKWSWTVLFIFFWLVFHRFDYISLDMDGLFVVVDWWIIVGKLCWIMMFEIQWANIVLGPPIFMLIPAWSYSRIDSVWKRWTVWCLDERDDEWWWFYFILISKAMGSRVFMSALSNRLLSLSNNWQVCCICWGDGDTYNWRSTGLWLG